MRKRLLEMREYIRDEQKAFMEHVKKKPEAEHETVEQLLKRMTLQEQEQEQEIERKDSVFLHIPAYIMGKGGLVLQTILFLMCGLLYLEVKVVLEVYLEINIDRIGYFKQIQKMKFQFTTL